MKEVSRAVHGNRRYVRYSGERTYNPKAYSLIFDFLTFKVEKRQEGRSSYELQTYGFLSISLTKGKT